MLATLANYIVNFLFILASMILFVLPFIAVFWYRRREQIKDKNPHFNYFFERFLFSKEASVLVATWAACEAVFWFVIPEFLLIMMIFMKVRNKITLVKYDIIGTVVGTCIALALHIPDHLLLHVPYIYQGMIDHVVQWYQQYGMFGIFFQPFSGVPYKVFTAEAPNFGLWIPVFIILAIIARMLRYIIIYEITKALYPLLHRFVYRHYGILVVIVIAVFTGLLMEVSYKYAS